MTGWNAGVAAGGDAVLAWKDGEAYDRPQGGGVLHAAVAPAGRPFGPAAVIEDHVFAMSGAGGALTWIEGRPEGEYEIDRRVRFASLLGDAAGRPRDRRSRRARRTGPPRGCGSRCAACAGAACASRSAPPSVRRCGRRGRRAPARCAGLAARCGPAAPGCSSSKAPARARRVTLAVTATDAAGNARTARRVVRLRRR